MDPALAPANPTAPLDDVASHGAAQVDPEADHAEPTFAEDLQELVSALRTHLLWLQATGVSGLPPSVPKARPVPQRPHPVPAPAGEAPHRPRPPTPSPHAPPPPPLLEQRPQQAPPPPATRPPVEFRKLPEPLPVFGQEGLDLIRDVLGACQRCKLCHGRTELVFGQGHPEPLIAFVGEGPGQEEDRTGLAFVGAAGDLLTQMINAMGEEAKKRGFHGIAPRLRRDQVYICNVVKCRPPGNRTPEGDETSTCGPFLHAQLRALRPKIIVALGRTPTHFLLQTTAPITKIRGQFSSWEGIPLMPTYHPAYLLRTPSAKRQAWDDLKAVIVELAQRMGAESPT